MAAMPMPRIDARTRRELVLRLQSTRAGKARDSGYLDIEDLVQDTLIRAMGREGTTAAFDSTRSGWMTWLVRVADDCMRTAWRQQQARSQLKHYVDGVPATARDWRRQTARRQQEQAS